ncbi:MAG: glutamine synthetase [Gemmatimonadota bacterium]|nr:MAG: glutamine synthetase [Gemmatimonadota bacterium]UCE19249.1 MAG: glutamine synthetase [Gemmatimonadota bacterium]
MGARNDELLTRIKKEKIQFLYLLFTDITGVPKKVTIQAAQAGSALKHGVWFDGSSIQGFARIYESDMLLKLDPETFSVLPWSNEGGKVAQIICDVYTPDEEPFEGDPRGVLKRVAKRARELGFVYNVGPEIEFFLLERDRLPELIPHDRKGYFDLGVQSRAVRICQDTMTSMAQMGIQCETYHHEVSQGQHEIDISYDNALRVADAVVSLKQTLKTHAIGSGLKVTFMPKPIYGINGSGMHVHQSLADLRGKNLFYSPGDKYNLSELAYHFLAGQIRHARALAAVVDPTVNSYKRLVPGYEAPIYVCWGRVNRSALLRIPQVTRGKARVGARVELRCPDTSCNPYLAFASMLAAGLDGVQRKWKPPKPVEENVYGFSDERLEEMGIATLPGNIAQAVDELEGDAVLKKALGKHLTEQFVGAKRREWRDFSTQVTPWEVEQYL